MADSDDDFAPPEDGINKPSSPSSLPTGPVACSAKKWHRQCVENVRHSPPKKMGVLPTNLQQISQTKNANIKRLQGSDANLSLRIVKVSLERQETHLRFNQKIGQKENKGAKPPPVRDMVERPAAAEPPSTITYYARQCGISYCEKDQMYQSQVG
jgi:hypothetical protein